MRGMKENRGNSLYSGLEKNKGSEREMEGVKEDRRGERKVEGHVNTDKNKRDK